MPPKIVIPIAAARAAAQRMQSMNARDRTRALGEIASAIGESCEEIQAANDLDIQAAQTAALPPAMLDRLLLDSERIQQLAAAVVAVAELPDLLGRLEREETRPNGLVVARMRIPLGVFAMIYESRPNVTTDAAALAIKSGNAVILRGGKEAFYSNRALGEAISRGLQRAEFPRAAVNVVSTTDRSAVTELLHAEGLIDLVIPRGGEELIRYVAENARVPVLKHYKGVCHVYVHHAADPEMALAICENGKTQRPGVCNATESILVDAAIAESFIPALAQRLGPHGVEIAADSRALAQIRDCSRAHLASADDWGREYLDLQVSLAVIDDIDDAITHITRYGSSHTESIVTTDRAAAERFLREVDSSTVLHNASTRFADGSQLGLGAEIGISTSKLHSYGPMGVEGLTTTKFVVRGNGQTRT